MISTTNSDSFSVTFTGRPLMISAKAWVNPGVETVDRVFSLQIDGVTVDEWGESTRNTSNNNLGFSLLYASSTPTTGSHTVAISSPITTQSPRIVVFQEEAAATSTSGTTGTTTVVIPDTITVDNFGFNLFASLVLFFAVGVFFMNLFKGRGKS